MATKKLDRPERGKPGRKAQNTQVIVIWVRFRDSYCRWQAGFACALRARAGEMNGIGTLREGTAEMGNENGEPDRTIIN